MKLTVTALLLLAAAICFAGEPRPIANGSTLFVDTNNGFDLFILAAFQVKGVPMKLVSTSSSPQLIAFRRPLRTCPSSRRMPRSTDRFCW